MRIVIVAFLAAALAGYAVARLGSGREESANRTAISNRMAMRDGRKAEHWRAEDFVKWPQANDSADPLQDEWADWSDDELRAALETGVKDPGSVLPRSDQQQVIQSMFGEWMRRHPDEARTWFEGLVSETMRQLLATSFAASWPKERAEEGLAYAIAHRDWFETNSTSASWELIKGAIESVAKRGVAAVDDLFRQLRENRLNVRDYLGCEFPEDFDFATLMDSPETKRLTEDRSVFFAAEWTKHNPDEAFQHLVVRWDEWKVPIREMFGDVLSLDAGEKVGEASQRAKWLAGKLAELPQESQRKVASVVIRSLLNPQVRGNFLAALPDGPVRAEMTASTAEEIIPTGRELTLGFLETAGDLEWRLNQLEAVDVRNLKWRLSGESETFLRTKMAEWQAPAGRAEAIVGRFYKLKK